MFEAALVPANTVATAKADSASVDVSAAAAKTLLLTLSITRIIEQESIDVSVWGSADGQDFGAKPLVAFPQKFYCGEHPLLLDLSRTPAVKFLRAHWEVGRWGRGSETPRFEFQLTAREIPPEILKQAQADALART